MRILVMVALGAALGVVVYRAHGWSRWYRIAVAVSAAAAIAALGYVVETQRQALAADHRWERLHCEFFADGRLKAVADDAVGLPIERFDPSRALSSDRLNDYLREISFCTRDGRAPEAGRCLERLRNELYAAAKETSPAAFAERLRKVALAIKSGPDCD
jgi:hypothetical protein